MNEESNSIQRSMKRGRKSRRLDWIVFWWVKGAESCARQQAKREDKPNRSNPLSFLHLLKKRGKLREMKKRIGLLFFLFHLFFVKRGPAARKTTRKRNEKRAARPSAAPISFISSQSIQLLPHLSSLFFTKEKKKKRLGC